MVAMANANETEHIKEMEERKCGNFAAVIQKLKVFLCSLIRLLNCFYTTVQPCIPLYPVSSSLSLSLRTINSNTTMLSHRFASLMQFYPGILCIKYKSRLAVLIKEREKNWWKRKSFQWCTSRLAMMHTDFDKVERDGSRLENRERGREGRQYKCVLDVLLLCSAYVDGAQHDSQQYLEKFLVGH